MAGGGFNIGGALNSIEIQAVARNVLQAAGGYAVAHGYATNDQATAIIGGLIAGAAVLWSLWEKQQHKAAVAQALATPVPDTAPVSPAAPAPSQAAQPAVVGVQTEVVQPAPVPDPALPQAGVNFSMNPFSGSSK